MRPWHAAISILLAFAAFESGVRLFQDDFGYLMWGLLHRGDWAAWIRGPEFFTYNRPLNGLTWWLSAQTGVDGALVRWVQVGLWVTAGTLLVHAAREWRAGVGAMLLLATNQVWVDVLTWRSWISTTGATSGMVAGVLLLGRGAAPGWVLAAGVVALGFKEVAALALACRALAEPRYRGVGAVLFLLTCMSSASSSFKLGIENIVPNLRFHAETLSLFAPLVPVLLACARPRFDGAPALLLIPIVFLPPSVAALCFAGVAAAAVARAPRWWLPLAATVVGPMLGGHHARQYLTELWALLIVFAIMQGRAPVSAWTWLAIVALGARSAVDFERHRQELRVEWAEQCAFLDSFHPAPAQHLYHPDPNWSWDLDALYWVEGGATLDGRPPSGTSPLQVGPRSGVWADLASPQ